MSNTYTCSAFQKIQTHGHLFLLFFEQFLSSKYMMDFFIKQNTYTWHHQLKSVNKSNFGKFTMYWLQRLKVTFFIAFFSFLKKLNIWYSSQNNNLKFKVGYYITFFLPCECSKFFEHILLKSTFSRMELQNLSKSMHIYIKRSLNTYS